MDEICYNQEQGGAEICNLGARVPKPSPLDSCQSRMIFKSCYSGYRLWLHIPFLKKLYISISSSKKKTIKNRNWYEIKRPLRKKKKKEKSPYEQLAVHRIVITQATAVLSFFRQHFFFSSRIAITTYFNKSSSHIFIVQKIKVSEHSCIQWLSTTVSQRHFSILSH